MISFLFSRFLLPSFLFPLLVLPSSLRMSLSAPLFLGWWSCAYVPLMARCVSPAHMLVAMFGYSWLLAPFGFPALLTISLLSRTRFWKLIKLRGVRVLTLLSHLITILLRGVRVFTYCLLDWLPVTLTTCVLAWCVEIALPTNPALVLPLLPWLHTAPDNKTPHHSQFFFPRHRSYTTHAFFFLRALACVSPPFACPALRVSCSRLLVLTHAC